WKNRNARCCSSPARASLGVAALTVFTAARQAAELVVLRKALRRDAACVGTVATPVLQLLDRQREAASRGVVPRHSVIGLECGYVREALFLVALQADAPAAAHFGHLVERENHHLAIFADGRCELTVNRRERARLVRCLQVQHLLAFPGGAKTLVFTDHETVALMACDQEF